MNICNDIKGLVINFLDHTDYINLAAISPELKTLVYQKMCKEMTVSIIIFGGEKTLPKRPMPKILLGDIIKNPSLQLSKLEDWIVALGGKKQNTKKYVGIPLFKTEWTEKNNKVFPFTNDWVKYFISIRDRVFNLPIFKLLELSFVYRNEGLRTNSAAEYLLTTFVVSDVDTYKMKKLKNSKWLCWTPILDGDQIDGYNFERNTWNDLEKIYTFVTGLPPRDPPDWPDYVEYDPTSQLIKNIKKWS